MDFDGEGPTWEGGIYFYGTRWQGDGRPQANGWGSRPDYGRPEVRQFIRDNALAWLEDYRIDGLRFDATAYIRTIDGSGSADQAIPGRRDRAELREPRLQQLHDRASARRPVAGPVQQRLGRL